jgi:hypothetical protein
VSLVLQLVMGGRYYSISPDEYVFAALNIYLVSGTACCKAVCHYLQVTIGVCLLVPTFNW